MDSFTKQIMFYELRIHEEVRNERDKNNKPVRFPSDITGDDFYNLLKGVYDADRGSYISRNKKKEMRLQHLVSEDYGYCFLVNFTFADGSHHASRNIKSKVRKERQYAPTEGPEHSSHIMLMQSDTSSKPLLLIEKVQGLNISALLQFLNFLLREAVSLNSSQYQKDHPRKLREKGGRIKKCIFRPKVELNGFIDSDFKSDLEGGSLKSIKLVSKGPKIAGMDVGLSEDYYEWSVKVKTESDLSGWDRIQQVIDGGLGIDMDTVKVNFSDDSNMNHTQTINLDGTLTDINSNYVKKKSINLVERPKASYDECDHDIYSKMSGLINDEE